MFGQCRAQLFRFGSLLRSAFSDPGFATTELQCVCLRRADGRNECREACWLLLRLPCFIDLCSIAALS